MYVVHATPPSFLKNSPKETRKNLRSVLLFCAHVDVIEIEKH